MRYIPHWRWGPAQCKSNCEEHAGSDKPFEIPWWAAALNAIYKANQSTNNPIELKIVLKLAHLLWPLEQKRNSCTVHRITQFRTTSCKYKIMTLLPKYGVSLTPKYGQKCKFYKVTQNLRVFAYVAWDYESAAEATSVATSVASLAIGTTDYGYG